jgi:hypothetical protein
LLGQVGHVGAQGFGHPQTAEHEQRNEREVPDAVASGLCRVKHRVDLVNVQAKRDDGVSLGLRPPERGGVGIGHPVVPCPGVERQHGGDLPS